MGTIMYLYYCYTYFLQLSPANMCMGGGAGAAAGSLVAADQPR